MGEGVGQRVDHAGVLHERPRPAVVEQQGRGAGDAGPDVHHVEGLAVDHGADLLVAVEQALLGPPVESVPPVAGQLPQVVDRHPATEVRLLVAAGDGERPPRPREAVVQVVELGRRDVDAEPDQRLVPGAGGCC